MTMRDRPLASASISAIEAACPDANSTASARSSAPSASSSATQVGLPFLPYPPGSPCEKKMLVSTNGGATGSPGTVEAPAWTNQDSAEKLNVSHPFPVKECYSTNC